MRMLLNIRVPHEPFNTAVREGTAGSTIAKILEDTRPEAVYFTEHNGTRGAVMIVDVAKASQVPFYAEPWFLKFNADCEFRVVMSPDDLKDAGLESLGKKWK
ncbi:MAG: panthothenate synthetase [Acidobacteriota bacterium]